MSAKVNESIVTVRETVVWANKRLPNIMQRAQRITFFMIISYFTRVIFLVFCGLFVSRIRYTPVGHLLPSLSRLSHTT